MALMLQLADAWGLAQYLENTRQKEVFQLRNPNPQHRKSNP